MPKENALAVMLKAPVEGEVKTRLIPPLTPKEAAILYKAFIKDTFSRLSKLTDLALYAFFTPFDKKAYIVDIIPQEISLIPQKDGDLGERMYSVFECLFNSGHNRVAIMGSDSPDIPLEYIETAFSMLKESHGGLVLGPATDGGYYLIAMDRLMKAPFEGIGWSADTVLKDTIKNASASGIIVKLLPEWHDIDRPEDLKFLEDNPDAPGSSACLAGIKKR
ncbi:MAG TPA: TIGR04282 family arsenosugar biosynthesis glycosyltransferase [Thermodesulfobacteriota bacterium]|nr:TIGR04282 family arsenosugar biosynthesis glycosyltransferase [Thermodesulfobacteriota bacterium]